MRVFSTGNPLISLTVLALIGLAAAKVPAAQTPVQNGSCDGGSFSGNFEIGVVMQTDEPYTIVMYDMVTGLEVAGSRYTISSATTQTNEDCHYYAYFDNADPGYPNAVRFM